MILNFIYLINLWLQPLMAEECLLNFDKIEIEGLKKTNEDFVRRELGLIENSNYCKSEIEQSIERLKSTGIFVNAKAFNIESKILKIEVEEKWTTIPILKINSGGGISQYTLGVYDPNLFGEYLESGIQYENLAKAGSGVVWFKNPRLFGKRQGIDLQYWNTQRVRIKYDQVADDPIIKTGFLQKREKIYFDYFKEINDFSLWRVSIDYNKDSFSTRILPTQVMDVIGPNPELPANTELMFANIAYEYGKISGADHARFGKVLKLQFAHAFPLHDDFGSFNQWDAQLQYFSVPYQNVNFASRLILGHTTTEVLQYWYYLGGLDRIRGFVDNRFSGRQVALVNSELRYLFYEGTSVHLQGSGFIDAAVVGEDLTHITSTKAASTGLGLRLILPRVYRFVLRMDLAKTILKEDNESLSFGFQQFF